VFPVSSARLAIPAALTLANAGCGFLALLALGHVVALPLDPAWLVFAGWFFDMIDGSVAKALGVSSEFGAQLDSLCDAVSFGLVPGVLVATAAGPWGAVAGFAYLAAALVRLARFNVEPAGDHMYFQGLASPSAAMTLAAGVLAGRAIAPAAWLAPAQAVLAVGLAVLMVSRLRYPDLPKHFLRGRKPWPHVLVAAALFGLLPAPVATFALCALYVVVGALPLGRTA